jgi:hypothetical protein
MTLPSGEGGFRRNRLRLWAKGNGATPQIFDLKRGCFAPWAKPRILWILTLSGVVFSAIHLLQFFRFTAMTGGAASIHIFTGKRQKSVYFKAKTFLCSLFFQTTLYYTSLNMV